MRRSLRTKLLAYAAAGLLAAGLGAIALPGAASAHGAMMMPGSRTWLCYKDGRTSTGEIVPQNPACAAAVAQSGVTPLYNWFAVLRSDGAGRVDGFIPSGQLCSGGTGGPYNFTGFNLARNDWPVTHLTSGKTIEIDYNDWAKHPGTFSLYITKDGYDPTKPLAWSDLNPTPFSQVTNPPANGGPGTDDGHYWWNATLPSGKTGKHLIYSVWARSDSTETFYGCSDVVFDGGNGEVTGVGNPVTPPPTTPTTGPTTSPTGGTGSGCTAMYNVAGSWTGGFQGQVMVHAPAGAAVGKWTVEWTWPGSQTLTQLWSGTATSSGSLVTVKNASWNGTIPAGGDTTFGFLGSGTTPTTVNNLTCSTA
ncbi:lytic polysaccharide monooxygenase auxiliary activity family 9 protein [Paractinoplanes globisporus]|uniref:Lytic polysaccharide monooxygenase n=1 Tax=Paractinoplanes globisporus TaxID=113565 RepID=A0ABW6WTH3_9ACTN|nr:lytic polysaccharide monooxygenase [Actinoplanes globisporus]